MSRPNQYAGTCCVCRRSVQAGAGFIARNSSDTGWDIICSSCPASAQPRTNSAAGTAKAEAKASKPPHEVGPSKSRDLNRLIKLMKLTTSATDGEALSAMRKANEWLARAGADWEQMLLGKVSVMADPFAEIAAPPPATQKAPDRDFSKPPRPTAPPRPTTFADFRTPPPRAQTAASPPPPKVDPFDYNFTDGTPDWNRPANPRAARARRRSQSFADIVAKGNADAAQRATAQQRTFATDVQSSTPSRKPAPSATDL